MDKKKTIIVTAVVTALATCFLTNVWRDIWYVQNNGKIIRKIDQVADHLKKDGLYEVDEEKLIDYAALGMTLSVDDPYTNYYTKEQFESYSTNLKNSYVGLGIVLSVDEATNQIVVVSPFEDGPGAQAGILAGDYILAIDGQEFNGESFNDAVTKLRGLDVEDAKETPVKLTIQRDGGQPFVVEVKRDTVEKDTVKSEMLSDGIAYMRISAFDSKDPNDEEAKDTFDEFNENLETLKTQGMTKLIIDLRDNPGGDLNVVTQIADKLLPRGIITYTEDKNGKKNSIYSDESQTDMPMAVLVNGGSASASEVLTGALKDYEKATVVGTKTYGKGIVQTVYPFSDGSGMSVTTARYFSPNGVCIHGVGIEPDVQAELPAELEKPIADLTFEEDVQLQKAVEILKAE